jgi:hypothetical protein
MLAVINTLHSIPPALWLLIAAGFIVGQQWRAILQTAIGVALVLLLIGLLVVLA